MNSTIGNRFERKTTFFPEPSPEARLFIYENMQFLGASSFRQKRIVIGKSRNIDLVLDHQDIADIHAIIQFDPGTAYLINKTNNGLRLNGAAVTESKLKAEDIIQIGPFSIIYRSALPTDRTLDAPRYQPRKAQPEVSEEIEEKEDKIDHGDQRYSVHLINQYPNDAARREAMDRFARNFRTDPQKIAHLFTKPQVVIKRDVDHASASQLQNILNENGILCFLQASSGKTADVDDEAAPLNTYKTAPVCAPEPTPLPAPTISRKDDPQPFLASAPIIYEDEEEEDPWVAPFVLHEKLVQEAEKPFPAQKRPTQLQVIKFINDRVVDVCYLEQGQKYHIHNNDGRFCLVENKTAQQRFVFLKPTLHGYAIQDGHERQALDRLRTEVHCYRKRKKIYRLPVSDQNVFMVSEGPCRYRIALAEAHASPSVPVGAKARALTGRHWLYSIATHLVLLAAVAVYCYIQASAPPKQAPHFVKIDLSALRALEAKKHQIPEIKKQPPPPKVEPQQVAEKVVPKKTPQKPPAPVQKARQSVKPPPKVATRQPSRDPKAGGGFGKGNVADRNVNQTGLLSILGKNAVSGPSQAIASVTNIDAVAVPGAREKNFSVGGVKGSLSSGKTSLGTSGGIVETKGSQQVMRSYGAGGKGQVAALEKGSTGQKQVRASVDAKLTRTVKIEGGMSRDMVARVINQHLEEITYCYESALVANPTIMGRVIFEWKILLNGRVGQTRIVSSSINSHEIHECIKSAIHSWQFPKPMGTEVMVSYPFVFDLVSF